MTFELCLLFVHLPRRDMTINGHPFGQLECPKVTTLNEPSHLGPLFQSVWFIKESAGIIILLLSWIKSYYARKSRITFLVVLPSVLWSDLKQWELFLLRAIFGDLFNRVVREWKSSNFITQRSVCISIRIFKWKVNKRNTKGHFYLSTIFNSMDSLRETLWEEWKFQEFWILRARDRFCS